MQPVHRRNVGVIQASQQLRFPLEPCQPLRLPGELFRQDLDCNFAVEGCVDRFPDHTHATLADLFDQAVMQ